MALSAMGATGCIGGFVYNSDNTPASNVAAFANTCPSCAVLAAQFTDSSGHWDYDPYSGDPGALPSDGEEATHIEFFNNQMLYDVYHTPTWQTLNGETVSGVVPVYFPTNWATGDTDGVEESGGPLLTEALRSGRRRDRRIHAAMTQDYPRLSGLARPGLAEARRRCFARENLSVASDVPGSDVRGRRLRTR